MGRSTLPKVTQYVKNVGKSVAFASIDAVSDNLNGIRSFADDNKEVFTEMYASVKNYRQSLIKAEANIKRSNIYKAVDYGIKNIIDDLKTGNFYNTSRSADIAETALGLDDESLDYDFSYTVSERSSESSSNSINDTIGAIAASNSTVVAQSTDLMIKTNKISTNLITTQIERSTAALSSSIGALYNITSKTNQFLNGPMLNHLENSKTYYENSLRILQDQQAMMKELLEMQRNLYKSKSKEYSSTKLENSMNYNGTINLKGYLKNVKGNIRSLMDNYGLSMFDLSGDTGMNPLMLMAAAPLKMVLDGLVEKMIPKNLKSSLKSFDSGFSSLFSQLMSRVSNKSKDSSNSGLMDIITQIFGIDIKKKTSINPSNYNKGPVPFDGIVRQSIIEVIPGYLARIEASLTGNGERFYDFNRGSWKSTNQIRKEFNDERKKAISSANYDIRSDLQKTLNSMSKEMAEDIRDSMYKFMEKVFDDYGDLKLDLVKDKNGNYKSADGSNAWKYYGFKNKNQFDVFLKSINISTIRNLAHNNLLAIEQYSKTLEDNELNGNIYTKLFNNSLNDKNPHFNAGGNLLSLSKDKYGHDVFYYLREILSNINNRRSSEYKSPKNNYKTSSAAPIGGSSRESETSSESEDDPGSWSDIEAELDKKRSEEYNKNQSKKATSNWIKGKFGNSVIGKFLNTTSAGISNIFSTPVKYMTELLDKASDNMFTMMFGDKDKYSNLKDDEGNSINNIFEYIIYKVDKSFKDLTNKTKDGVNNLIDRFIRPFISKYIKPLFDKYGRPVIDEVKSFGRRAGARVKQGVNNTFGRAYRAATRPKDKDGYKYEDNLFNMASDLADGGVVSADDVEANINDSDGLNYDRNLFSARGRVVTKRGLTMISPGEIIIPASSDPKVQNKMLSAEKKDRNRILKAFGRLNSGKIGLNAKGTIDTEELKRKLQDIYNENIGDNKGAKVGAGGVIGGLTGLLAGVNPLLGAAAGAGISILNNSETLKKVVFGDIGEDGERTGGIVSKKVYDIFKKAAPDMGDFGIAGGLLGLVTPFGPLAGAAIGAGVGYLKNSESFKKFIFGDEASGKEGFIKKESYDKFKETVKKAAPSILLGAGAGILAGPFGLLGNAAMGAGLGLVSSTDEFHKFLFGRENAGGLLSAFQNGILDPAKEHILGIMADLKNYAQENILDPMKRFWEPFKQDVRNIIQGTADSIKDHINDMFEKTIGLPLADFLQEKVFKPITNTLFKVIKAPINIGKAIVSAPFKLLGLTGDARRARQIRKGKAYDMSASERLAYRDEHKFRFNKFRRDKMLSEDQTLANLSVEDLESLASTARAGVSTKAELQNRLGKAHQAIGDDISAFFNEKNEKGATRYSRVNYKLVKDLAKTASSGDLEGVYSRIDNMKDLTDDEKKALKDRLKDKIAASVKASNELDLANNAGKDLDGKLKELLGRKVNGRSDRRQIMRSAEAELRARRKGTVNETPEESATNNLAEIVDNRAKSIISDLSIIRQHLEHIVNPGAKDTKSASDKEAAIRNKLEGNSNDSTSSTDITIKDSISKSKNTGKGSFIRNIFDQVTGRFIPDNPDSKEAVENEKERNKIRNNEAQNTEENKKTNSILSKMSSFFFGKKKDDEDEGIISKLFKGVKKFGKFIGMAGLALTGVSLFGHATEWFKTSVWPKIKETLFGKTSEDGTTISEGIVGGLVNKGKSLLFGEDGQSGLVGKLKTILLGENLDGKGGLAGWLNEKIISPVTDFFSRVKNLWDANGGLSGIISGVLVPKLVAGWGYTMNNVVTPVVALVIKHLPSMLASLGTAIFNGIKMAIFNKEIKRSNETISTDAALAEYRAQADGNNSKIISSLDNATIKLFSTSSSAYKSSDKATIDYSALLDDNYATEDQTYDAAGNHLNKTSNEIMYNRASGISGLLGAKNATNDIYYDENGNIGLNSYNRWNTTDSIASTVARTAGKGFIRGLVGANPGTGLARLMSKISARGAGKGFLKAGTGFIGGIANVSGNLINSGANAGIGINNMMRHGMDISNVHKSFAETVANAGGGNADEILQQVSKNGLDNVAANLYKNGDEAVGLIADSAAKNAKNNINIIDTFYSTAAKTTDDIVEAGAKSSDNIINRGIQAVSNAASNAKDNIGAKIASIFANLADTKLFGMIFKACSAETTEIMLKEALEKIGKKIGDNLLGKAAKNALGKVASVLGKFSPVTIVFWIADFIHGYDNADTILGVAKGDEYKVNIGQKCLCGLLNLINNQITLGLIPTDTIVDIIVEFLFPLFGLDTESLNAARERADNILDEWNKAHPEETYSNLEDFNNKDKWTTKVKNSIAAKWEDVKTGAKNTWENVKTGAKNTWENIKTGAGNLWEGAKTTVGNAIDGIKEFGAGIWEKVSPYVESIKGIPTLIGNIIKDAINYGKTNEHIDGALNIDENDPLIGLKKGIVNIGKVMTLPLAMFTKVFIKIKEKVLDPLITNVKAIGGNVITGVTSIFSNAWKGDLSAAFSVKAESNEDESGLTTGISNVILGVVKTVGSVPILLTSAVGKVKNSITAFINAAKQIIPVVAVAAKEKNDAAWHPDQAEEDAGELQSTGNETLDSIANVVLKITDVFNTPNRLLGKAFNIIKTKVTAFTQSAKLVLTNVAVATKQRNDAAWHPDQAEEDAGELQSTGNETLDSIANVVLKITDVFNTPSRLLGKAFNTVKGALTAFINSSKLVLTNVAVATKQRNDAAWHPDQAEEDAGELQSTGNETLDSIANVVLKITDVFNTPNRLLGKAFNTVKGALTAFINSSKLVLTNVAVAAKEKNDAAWHPDQAEEDAGELQSTGNETLDSIANVVLKITDVFNTPSRLLGKAVNAVKNGIETVISKYAVSQETKKEDDAKIDKALDGDLSLFSKEYWTNADHKNEGIFGVIANVQTYIEKVMNAPVIIIKSIVSKISDAFKGIKEWFGEKFGGIWEWITGFFNDDSKEDAIESITTDSNNSNTGSGRNKNKKNTSRYGLGHVCQSSELISKIPYGDSTIGEAGCAPVAATNLLNNLNTGTNIYEAASYAEQNRMTVPGGGTDIKYFNSFLGSKGIPTKTTSSRSAIMNALKEGNQVIMLGRDSHDNPGAPFGTIPHYVTAKSISSNGNIIAEDPDLPNSSIEYNPSDVMGSMITSVIADVNGRKRSMNRNNRRAAVKMAARARNKISLARKEMAKIRYGLGNMLGPEAILNVARSQIGVEEGPRPNENKYNNAYWGNPSYGTQDDWQWCVVFVWWVFNQAGASKLFYDGGRIAYVGNGGLNDFYARKGKYSKSDPKPGDIAVVKWDTNSPQHAAIVESVSGNTIRIIDGNSNINGSPGIVANHDISMNEIHGFCHIDYPYEYDKSSVVDMSKYGDNTNYESIAKNGGSMSDSAFNSSNSSSSSTGGTLLDSLSNLGKSMVKAIYGENAYNALFGTVSTSSSDNESSSNTNKSSSLSGNSNAEKIWNYLRSKGYSKHGTAGIMGNLYAESRYIPNNVEGAYEDTVGNDTEYTNKVNNGSYSKNSFSNDAAGYGLAQWTYNTLKQGLYENTVEKGIGIGDLKGQLDYLDSEMYRNSSLGNYLRNATNYSDASDKFMEEYERPAYYNYDDRRDFAREAFDAYSNESNSTSYTPLTYDYTSNNTTTNSTLPNRAVSGKYELNNNVYSAMGRGRKVVTNTGNAARALNQVSSSISRSGNNIKVNNNYSTSAVEYQVFLQTIVEILTSIAGNTALLSKILEILSTKLDIDFDRSEIERAASINKAKTEQTLNDLINRNGGAANMSKVLNNKDTSYLLSAMSAIASE